MEKKKESSYSKMKRKYEEKINALTSDILSLVDETEYSNAEFVRAKWKHIIAIEKVIWYGSPTQEHKPNNKF